MTHEPLSNLFMGCHPTWTIPISVRFLTSHLDDSQEDDNQKDDTPIDDYSYKSSRNRNTVFIDGVYYETNYDELVI